MLFSENINAEHNTFFNHKTLCGVKNTYGKCAVIATGFYHFSLTFSITGLFLYYYLLKESKRSGLGVFSQINTLPVCNISQS
jgi:hypothetical protein